MLLRDVGCCIAFKSNPASAEWLRFGKISLYTKKIKLLARNGNFPTGSRHFCVGNNSPLPLDLGAKVYCPVCVIKQVGAY